MANNETQATLNSEVVLTGELRAILEATGASIDDRRNGHSYVYWCEYFNEDLASALEDAELPEEAIEKWQELGMEDLLREILRLNPTLKVLQIEAACTCSKMRLGEFGGFALVVTPTQYCWINTGNVVLEDGKLVIKAQVRDFVDDGPATD